jgi:glyoxylase-like metal-dependent hydrolase (beta-lactamase superfamily II)/predicted small secreted protein
MKKALIIVLVINVIAVTSCGTNNTASSAGNGIEKTEIQESGGFSMEIDGVFYLKLGKYEVFMLVDTELNGNPSILAGADQTILEKYIPAEGFKHTANAFLIRGQGRNILFDAGTGAGYFLIDKIKMIGIELEQIDTVFITHLHGDHFAGLQSGGKAHFPNAKIYINAIEHDFFTKTNVDQSVVNILSLYTGNIVTFEAGGFESNLTEIIPGITAIANYGHTPGHTIYLIQDGNEKLLICGDFLHVALVQFSVPSISAVFDMNYAAAAVSRRQILEYAARNNILIGGMHIVFPGIGSVEAEGEGFKFSPIR